MLTVEQAAQTLKESGACFFIVTGNGNNIKFDETMMGDTEPTPEECEEKFLTMMDRLKPAVYEVAYWKTAHGRRNPGKMRVYKNASADQAPGMGLPAFDPAMYEQVGALREQLKDMQHQADLQRIKWEYEEKLRKEREKSEEANSTKDLIMSLKDMFIPKKGTRKLPQQPASAAPISGANEETNAIQNAIIRLHAAMGEDDEKLIEGLNKLAAFAEESPVKFNTYMNML